MTTDTDTIKAILRDLVAAFTDRPEGIKIAHQAACDGSVYWALQCDPIDEAKLIGKQGCHVDALGFLVQQIGAAMGQVHTFRLITVNQRIERPPADQRDVLEYDPQPARDLLCRVIEELVSGAFTVHVGPGNGPRHSLTFVFTIRLQDTGDVYSLTQRFVLKTSEGRDGLPTELTVVGALGTLFRAIAKKNGVRFQVAVEE